MHGMSLPGSLSKLYDAGYLLNVLFINLSAWRIFIPKKNATIKTSKIRPTVKIVVRDSALAFHLSVKVTALQ